MIKFWIQPLKFYFTFLLVSAYLFFPLYAFSDDELSKLLKLDLEQLAEARIRSSNPMDIGHVHPANEGMFGYRFMFMDMNGNRSRSSRVSDKEVLEQFSVSPTDMKTQMHMFEFMYGVSERLTLMAMFPYTLKSMNHVTRTGRRFKTKAEGIGDLELLGLFSLYSSSSQRVHFDMGVSLPLGSTTEKDDTPAGFARLPYPMQLGSGTFDLLPGITYIHSAPELSWGGKISGVVRLGENSQNYTLGNRVNTTVWLTKIWSELLSSSLSLKGEKWGNIDGADPTLSPQIVPTADPKKRAGERVMLSFSTNLFFPTGILEDQRISLSAGLPIYQRLDGPQLEMDWTFGVQWKWSF